MDPEYAINLTDAQEIADALNIASGTSNYDDSSVGNTFPAVTAGQLAYLKLLAAWIKAHG